MRKLEISAVKRRGILASLLAAIIAWTYCAPAIADSNFADGIPDGGNHSWCVGSGFNHEWRAGQTMALIDDQTKVSSLKHSECKTKTDVVWKQGSLLSEDGRAYGRAVCKAYASGKCDKYEITLDMVAINGGVNDTNQLKKTMCHEVGHTLGLSHYSKGSRPGSDSTDSCMLSGSVSQLTSTAWLTRYGKHHIEKHINKYF